MDHNPLFDRLWIGGFNPFGSPYKLEDYMNENFETEVFETYKGNYKTTIVCKFNKEGYLVSHSTVCEDTGEDTQAMRVLKDELAEALFGEEYEDARLIQLKINKLRELTELKNKPTL